jgi:hypothetical protein
MPRNIAKPVSDDVKRATIGLVHDMRDHAGPVRINYTKRNGERKTYTGYVQGFPGVAGMDTFSVNLKTQDEGTKTLNLCRIDMLVLMEGE